MLVIILYVVCDCLVVGGTEELGVSVLMMYFEKGKIELNKKITSVYDMVYFGIIGQMLILKKKIGCVII